MVMKSRNKVIQEESTKPIVAGLEVTMRSELTTRAVCRLSIQRIQNVTTGSH